MKKVIRTVEDMVMVFDEDGDEMPQYQGHYTDVRDRIISDARTGTEFVHWFGASFKPRTVTMEEW